MLGSCDLSAVCLLAWPCWGLEVCLSRRGTREVVCSLHWVMETLGVGSLRMFAEAWWGFRGRVLSGWGYLVRGAGGMQCEGGELRVTAGRQSA